MGLYWLVFSFLYGMVMFLAFHDGYTGEADNWFSFTKIAIYLGSSASALYAWLIVGESLSEWLYSVLPAQDGPINEMTVTATIVTCAGMLCVFPQIVMVFGEKMRIWVFKRRLAAYVRGVQSTSN